MRAQNTYLLALDGDIDFQAEAITRLVDKMKKNQNLGAACGRILPTGSGFMVIERKTVSLIRFLFTYSENIALQIHSVSLALFSRFGIKNLNMQSVIGFKKPPNMLWDVSCVALDVSVYLEEEHLWMLMSWRDTQLIRLNQYIMSRYFKVIEHKLSKICFKD